MTNKKQPKIAIVHDWITNKGGAERVVLAFHDAFPDAPIFTSVYTPENIDWFDGMDVRTTYLQDLPKILRKLHKFFPILRVRAFQKLDLSEYDIILSSCSAEAKQVKKTRPDQIHICYCHTPIRYYWSHYDEYRKNPGFGKLNWLVRLTMPLFVPPLRNTDFKAAQEIDFFIANSSEVKARIEKYYKKPAIIINPPVDVKRFTPTSLKKRGDYYMAFSRQIPYKRIDLAISAANELKLPLRVYGDGSEHQKLVDMAGPTVKFYPGDHDAITKAFNSAKGYIFPAMEDFGIVQAESLASGTPVICYGKGGALDIIRDGETGVYFNKQTTKSVITAIKKAETIQFDPKLLNMRAKRFDAGLFVNKIKKVTLDHYYDKNRN
ncbi:glycosyltransferase family 4 protein [Candidatus Saccharibacteria bacterium HGW-Saccharibacteria-1]|jgi:glycosyltransferase involved in cell wall biosynthesis|nr:MAG: glycosyltransferase family 4 protein [Candidatus Saccharibacteria bacterium HGW-Saccharibacteria-1]